ncbi:ribonuclease E activity regulator RraA [Phycicoccus sonneratiae]|uniref:4-hydroxy-4-methyl-2-oxoglutarate aldolase n=1 Tax=Phycicoccus sonneratiae TaxID=2807628 RepID=A0ABS2CQJ8_9MICO|nr:ribonuclease E activity regulator RraA [Phycicoccus sonneraticus]MBM6402156.1 ribonuclease E activity regulator RraA [Phycicoccus sonneraticus]
MKPTADLYDDHGEALQSCHTQFRNLGGRSAFEGQITTVKVFEDNVIVKQILAEEGAGRVLVVDGAGSLSAALMGDKMADLAAANGWEGVIINGAVRDVDALAGVDLGIKALGSNPRKSTKNGIGQRDVDVTFGGATFIPGQRLHSDNDGILTTRG